MAGPLPPRSMISIGSPKIAIKIAIQEREAIETLVRARGAVDRAVGGRPPPIGFGPSQRQARHWDEGSVQPRPFVRDRTPKGVAMVVAKIRVSGSNNAWSRIQVWTEADARCRYEPRHVDANRRKNTNSPVSPPATRPCVN